MSSSRAIRIPSITRITPPSSAVSSPRPAKLNLYKDFRANWTPPRRRRTIEVSPPPPPDENISEIHIEDPTHVLSNWKRLSNPIITNNHWHGLGELKFWYGLNAYHAMQYIALYKQNRLTVDECIEWVQYLQNCTPEESEQMVTGTHTHYPEAKLTLDDENALYRVREQLMYDVLLAKFKTLYSFGEELTSTGDARLIYHSKDTYWGVHEGQGKNVMGLVLETVRKYIGIGQYVSYGFF